MKDVITTAQFTLDEVLNILEEAQEMVSCVRNQQINSFFYLFGLAKVALFFAEPSTRTLGSYKEAAERLGFRTQEISGKEATSLMKGESFADTIRTLASQGADVLVIRTKYEGGARFAAEVLARGGYPVSAQNAGDGANQHPTQALLNLLALKTRLGRIHNFIFGMVGDLKYSRTINSDLDILRLLHQRYKDIKIKAVSAPETRIEPYRKYGLDIEEGESLELLSDCDVIMVTRIQEERFVDPNELRRVRGRFVINRRVLEEVLRSDVIIMHPLPRREEISPEISNDRRIFMWKQMEFGIPLRMVLLRRGYLERKNDSYFSPDRPAKQKIIVEEPAEDRLRKGKERGKQEKYFRPIYEKGMIIDHLPFGMGDLIKRLIRQYAGLRGEGCIHTLEGVKRLSTGGRKDVIVLEGQYIPEEFYGIVAFVAPEVTFNVIEEGLFRKIKVDISGSTISKAFNCPNTFCITNNDPEAKPRFVVHNNGRVVVCDYCNRFFNREEILSNFC